MKEYRNNISMKKTISTAGTSHNFVSLERLTFLVDGIFAITMTLLVLDLRPQESTSTGLGQSLPLMLPRLLIYFIAFYSIANYWLIHERLFRYISGLDAALTWLVMLEVLFITLIPFSTALVGRFPRDGFALACFSANSLLHAVINWIFCTYAARKQKQYAVHTDARVLTLNAQVWLLVSAGYLIS